MNKGIMRVDSKRNGTYAWYATIRRKSGEVTRIFTDGKYGGKTAAQRAAIAWISEQWARYPLVPRLDKMRYVRRNNRSGVSGVGRCPADGTDVPGAYWAARWVVKPRQKLKSRKFSIAEYGEQTAKRLAIKARRLALASMEE